MTIGITLGLALLIFFAFGIILARRQSETKKAAIADLQREKEALASVNVRALAEEEATDLGLPTVRGAAGVPLIILLKVWKAHEELRARCPSPDLLEFVVADGVAPADATEADVHLRCDGAIRSPSPADRSDEGVAHTDPSASPPDPGDPADWQ